MCAAHVNNFSSNLVERVDFSDSRVALLWAGFSKFFLINNIELKCSFAWCRKYQKSWSNGAAIWPHLGRFALWHNCYRATQLRRFTLWHNGRRVTQLGKSTLWPDNGCRAVQLSRFTLWHKGSRTKTGLMHAPGIVHIFQRQWPIMLKKNKA